MSVNELVVVAVVFDAVASDAFVAAVHAAVAADIFGAFVAAVAYDAAAFDAAADVLPVVAGDAAFGDAAAAAAVGADGADAAAAVVAASAAATAATGAGIWAARCTAYRARRCFLGRPGSTSRARAAWWHRKPAGTAAAWSPACRDGWCAAGTAAR